MKEKVSSTRLFLVLSAAAALMLSIQGCSYTYKITSGSEAFEVKQYAVAAELLELEYRQTSDMARKAEKAYLLGAAYEYMNEPENAADWYGRAAAEGYGTDAMKKQAENLRMSERYQEAMAIYNQLMQRSGSGLEYRSEIVKCQQAMQWQNDAGSSEYMVSLMPFNSPASDYAPYVAGPSIVLFTSDRPNGSKEVYNWTGRGFSDIYQVNTASNLVQPYDAAINSEFNDGTVAISSDGDELFFSRCVAEEGFDMYCQLMRAQKRGNRWGEPERLPFVQPEINYGHPVISRNDSVLIFVSDGPDGRGAYDLYYSVRIDDSWDDPVPFPDYINTAGNEQFPSMHRDTLYFSSDGHTGMGGLDIYKSYLTDDGRWTPPVNLKPPVNSGWDDFGFVVDTFSPLHGDLLERGYFTSSRSNGRGSDDIYAYERRKPQLEEQAVVADGEEGPEAEIDYQLFLAIRVVEPIFEDPEDPNSERIGKRPLSKARVILGEGMRSQPFRTNDEGYLILEVDWTTQLDIQAKFRGFLSRSATFDAAIMEKDPEDPVKTYNMEIVLDPIFRGKEIVLENIYYDLDEWYIREDAKPPLNELAAVLADNPGIRIELGSHTDCRAPDDYNLELSQKRAQSAVDYLMARGIDAGRLVAKGYGETVFAVDCICEECTEEQHQANRRTTFKIIQ